MGPQYLDGMQEEVDQTERLIWLKEKGSVVSGTVVLNMPQLPKPRHHKLELECGKPNFILQHGGQAIWCG